MINNDSASPSVGGKAMHCLDSREQKIYGENYVTEKRSEANRCGNNGEPGVEGRRSFAVHYLKVDNVI